MPSLDIKKAYILLVISTSIIVILADKVKRCRPYPKHHAGDRNVFSIVCGKFYFPTRLEELSYESLSP